MTIQTNPKSAMLTWPGLSKLAIPSAVSVAADGFIIEISREGISNLPAPFNKATCWLSCREAWPHADPDFEGLMFITIAVQGDHRYCQLLPNHTHSVCGVSPGSVFTTDPLSLHWLAPNADNGAGFIGLQFEVPYTEADDFYAELLEQLSEFGTVRSSSPAYNDSLLIAASEYVGPPPGPLAHIQLSAPQK